MDSLNNYHDSFMHKNGNVNLLNLYVILIIFVINFKLISLKIFYLEGYNLLHSSKKVTLPFKKSFEQFKFLIMLEYE
jgi:hypothetical protein